MPPQASNGPAQPSSEPTATHDIAVPSTPVVEPVPIVSPQVGAVLPRQAVTQKPVEIFSYNSKSIKRSRVSNRFLSLFGLLLILLFIGAIVAAWLRAGAPTSVSDIPAFDELIRPK